MIRLRHLVTVAVVLLPPIAAAGAWQEGQIRGVVQDATRSGLPGATLTVTNQTTKQTRTVTTAADGSTRFLCLPDVTR